MMFDDDPSKSAEDKMSDALGQGCVFAIVAVLFVVGLIATIIKAWS